MQGGSITVSDARRPPTRRRREQGDHAAVRVADEVVAGPSALGDQPASRLEVDALDGRLGREAGSLEDEELEPRR